MNEEPKPDPADDASGETGTPSEGWEALSEEPSAGTLSPSDELEAALREASEAVESRGKGGAAGAGSADKVMLEALSAELQALKSEYEAKSAELEKLNAVHVRLQADFENVRRRGLKGRQEAHAFGHQNLVKDLLPTVDNLDRAIAHAAQSSSEELQGLLQGVELVRRELMGALGNHGVKQVESHGVAFDPAVHEAMAQIPRDDVPPNTVVEVMQEGYLLRDRMLRPARVIVSRAPAEGEAVMGPDTASEESS